MSTNTMTETKTNWPSILDRHVKEIAANHPEYSPRRIQKRFHSLDVSLWEGFVHVNDIDGYVENIRLKFYLKRWQARRGHTGIPTSDEIYEIMLEADTEEDKDSQKPFHVARIAKDIATNGIHERIIVFFDGHGPAQLWDGNRRYYGTKHIMRDERFAARRPDAQWIPAYVVLPSGNPQHDGKIKHAILTECNFKVKDHIPWPNYVKASEIYERYEKAIADDPKDPTLRRLVKENLANEYGLRGWRTADRWIKMYDVAMQFKEYHELEQNRDGVDVDLRIQDKFEYFDELSKNGVWGPLQRDPDALDEVFQWLWDGKFRSFTWVRDVPKILSDPVARRMANAPDDGAVDRAIKQLIANDPTRTKDKEAANEKIKQFGDWLNTFKREDYRTLNREALDRLRLIAEDTVKILEGLLGTGTEEDEDQELVSDQ